MSESETMTLIDAAETAKLLGIPLGTLRNNSTVLPRRKVGRRVVYLKEELLAGVRDCPNGENVFAFFARRQYAPR